MDIFELRDRLVEDYRSYTRSFIKIRDQDIKEKVEGFLDKDGFWPAPLLQLNPSFHPGGTIDELVEQDVLHKECARIFRIDKSDTDPVGQQLQLYEHQREGICKAKEGKSYVLTSGTGSGKSLSYIVPIVDHVLRHGSGGGLKAIIVYPMNALANSQDEELKKFLEIGYAEGNIPVRCARYTGQEKGDAREAIRNDPPDILLTNYMMLELLLTRVEDRALIRAAQGLQFLVFDEFHTYRGRQGADVAMLIRRCREAFGGHDITCIGTSATMASSGAGAVDEEQRQEVANVAKLLFGVPFTTDQVIEETLQRVTPEINNEDAEIRKKITKAVKEEASPPENYKDFCAHPLASWIESTFGVRREENGGRLLRQLPRRLEGEEIDKQSNASNALAELTDLPAEQCIEVLRDWLLHGSRLTQSESSHFPVFAFRLHQFFSRGDTVWASLEAEQKRYLSLAKLVAQPEAPEKPLYPLVFCRRCGTEYYRVQLIDNEQGRSLLPREDRRTGDIEGATDAYLYISQKFPWPCEDTQDVLQRVPDYFKEKTSQGGERINRASRKNMPESVFVDSSGKITKQEEDIAAALIPGKFLFCLDPACRVSYTRRQRSERNKLATLGVDNRSTATTILAVRSLIALRQATDLDTKARKLLSFTDNRQDAALQAGHFNDFVQVALLRSALHRATQQGNTTGGNTTGLRHGDLSRSVFDAMQLDFDEYAADPDVHGQARQATHDALRRVIEYFLYRDLERGWRVTAPNLEDCDLLHFDYAGLSGEESLLAEAELWEKGFSVRDGCNDKRFVETPLALQKASAEKREELLHTMLDVMRHELSVKIDVLDKQKQHELVEQTKSRLLEGTVWHLEHEEELSKAKVTYPRSKTAGRRNYDDFFLSSYGSYGHYAKELLSKFLPNDQRLRREDIDEIIRFLMLALKRYGIIEQVRSERNHDDPGYQINADALRWLPGEGKTRPVDRTRLHAAGETPEEANRYFVQCYREFADLRAVLEAREHTAQVTAEDRKEREQRFRTGALPLLFCSPTMELGVDIAQLNLVNLRNVPPTPANYAQRSGRAGRSGQSALVFTYCAGRSPHDQYFYNAPTRMVSGTVSPPRIDLRNQDLLRSHIHAIWMEVAQLKLESTLESVLDLSSVNGRLALPIKEGILRELRYPPHRAAAYQKASALIRTIQEDLESTSWFHEQWLKNVLDQVERSFESACNRWRELYQAAVCQQALHHKIIRDHSRSESQQKRSKRLRGQAESQISLLTKAEGIYEGDFYSYRYFATEGFLPGYNFPRLPISAYVPGRRMRKGRDEFVSRPRFLAISDFGPRALVYHEGARYRAWKVNLAVQADDIENTNDLATDTMKRCPKCGYAHLEMSANNLHEICAGCKAPLDGSARIENMVQMQNVSLKLTQRITCDEEERQRFGYRLETAYHFPKIGDKTDRKDAQLILEEQVLMRLSYGDATNLYRINRGWKNQSGDKAPGFKLDIEGGYWASNQADDQDKEDAANSTNTKRVVPYVRDTKNALVIRFDPIPSGPEMAGLQAAFKQAIQQHFQLESRELSCESMPTQDQRREILFYESSEGGAGVLRQLAEETSVLPQLARRALEICHYDPDTLEDLGAKKCGKACYKCLLDYGNQLDHKDLDRALIRDLLKKLANASCQAAGGAGSRADRLMALRARCDSKLEKRWLEMLDSRRLRLPSNAQYQVPGFFAQPDFFYRETNAAIFIDGPPHDEPQQQPKDEKITQGLMELGYIVIRFHHEADWQEILQQYPDIFGDSGV